MENSFVLGLSCLSRCGVGRLYLGRTLCEKGTKQELLSLISTLRGTTTSTSVCLSNFTS